MIYLIFFIKVVLKRGKNRAFHGSQYARTCRSNKRKRVIVCKRSTFKWNYVKGRMIMLGGWRMRRESSWKINIKSIVSPVEHTCTHTCMSQGRCFIEWQVMRLMINHSEDPHIQNGSAIWNSQEDNLVQECLD